MTFFVRSATCVKATIIRTIPREFCKTDDAIQNMIKSFYGMKAKKGPVEFPILIARKIHPQFNKFQVLKFYPEDFIRWK